MEKIKYKSTRGCSDLVNSSEAILRGIAPDGGLYMPTFIPHLNVDDLYHLSYQELALKIFSLYMTDFSEKELNECIMKAYDDKFKHKAIAPVVSFDKVGFIELFHGKTLAFKDMALSILPYFMTLSAKKNQNDDKIVILAATSGDTGKAALEGFKNVEGTEVIVYYPNKGISDIQKRQMTTQLGHNVHVYGIKGNFDDAQSGVKTIFADNNFTGYLKNKKYRLSSANSINIGRLLPQIVYYYSSYIQLVDQKKIQPGEKINVIVPSGNFGNLLACKLAKMMGLPVNQMTCASNSNHVLTDFFQTGCYDINRSFEVTMSPSMDILISSNLERLLYLLYKDTNPREVECFMNMLKTEKKYCISKEKLVKLNQEFSGIWASEADTEKMIKKVYKQFNYVIDPHTAVAYHAYENQQHDGYTLIAATASPYKFPRSVLNQLSDLAFEHDNDFELISALNQITGLEIPDEIIDLKTQDILHEISIEKDEILKSIVKALDI